MAKPLWGLFTTIVFLGGASASSTSNNASFLVLSKITVQNAGKSSDQHAFENSTEAIDDCHYNGTTSDYNGEGLAVGDRITEQAGSVDAIEGGDGCRGCLDTDDESDIVEDDYYPAPGDEVMDGGIVTSSSSSSSALWRPKTDVPLCKKYTPLDPDEPSYQPLRTLRRLQAMLDDSDYVTHSVVSSSSPSSSPLSIITPTSVTLHVGVDTKNNDDYGVEEEKSAYIETAGAKSSEFDKLWTSKDRAKYRRARSTDKQRQQDENACKLRYLERQQIIHEERGRKNEFLIFFENKEEELWLQQKRAFHFDESTDLTDDETDDAHGYYGGIGGGSSSSVGFELPNLPVYLSDGETEEDEENEDYKKRGLDQTAGSPIDIRNHQEQQQHQQQGCPQATQQNMMCVSPSLRCGLVSGVIGQLYYNSHEARQGHNQQQWQQSPSFHMSNEGNHQKYLQQYLHLQLLPLQQKQALPLSQPFQYGQNPLRQQPQFQTNMKHNRHKQYDQEQYAARVQAAAAAAVASGYSFPGLPPHPHHSAVQGSLQVAPQQQEQTQQFPYVPNPQPQQQNQGSASYVIAEPQHFQRIYQMQQQQGGRGGLYSHITSQQQGATFYRTQRPPPLQLQHQLRHYESSHYKDDSISVEQGLGYKHMNNEINCQWSIERPLSQPFQEQQHLYKGPRACEWGQAVASQSNMERIPTLILRDALFHTAASKLDELKLNEMTNDEAVTTSTDTSNEILPIIEGRLGMGVKSPFLSPRLTAVTPSGSSSRTAIATSVATIVKTTCIEQRPDDESEQDILISGAKMKISFDSIQKVSFAALSMALLSYCAVSPRSLPFPEYNRLFLHNLSIVGIGTIAPVAIFLAVFDGRYNNINSAIGTFYVSFTLGYALALTSEIVVTTAVRLGVFKIWEPAVFSLTPMVPSIILPWVLREKQYKPKRITLFAADFWASCLVSPIIEESLKLKVVHWSCKLPRNFKRSKDVQNAKRRRNQSLQPVRSMDAPQVTNINCYVTQMLAASLGLKLFDITRRILMYTKDSNLHKRTYAVCRGTFPIHELCGTMTALMLACRDVLGVNLPQWQILGPAVFIHGMANFRGMKPIFKWNSSTPWSEMQLNQLKGTNHIWKQLLPKSYAKLVWLTILCRVYGFCLKNYYLIGRQAMKRTTTYSGKLHAFNAKLQTDAMLKKTKSD